MDSSRGSNAIVAVTGFYAQALAEAEAQQVVIVGHRDQLARQVDRMTVEINGKDGELQRLRTETENQQRYIQLKEKELLDAQLQVNTLKGAIEAKSKAMTEMITVERIIPPPRFVLVLFVTDDGLRAELHQRELFKIGKFGLAVDSADASELEFIGPAVVEMNARYQPTPDSDESDD